MVALRRGQLIRCWTFFLILERFRDTAASSELLAEQALLEGTSLEKLGWLCVDASKIGNWISSIDPNTQKALSNLGYDGDNPKVSGTPSFDDAAAVDIIVRFHFSQRARFWRKRIHFTSKR